MKKFNRVLSMILALAMVLSMCPGLSLTAFAAETVTPITGGETISAGGEYQLAADATGIITVATTEPVTIIGNGAAWDDSYTMTTSPNASLGIICTEAGADLTIQDVYATIGSTDSLIDFVGTGNKLTLAGVSVLENEGTNGSNAVIHVPSDGDLTIDGEGTLYLYKSSIATGIGGDTSETNGAINFTGGTVFVKGSKTGAVIGAGQGACGGEINVTGGSLYVMGKARGACLGGSGYSGGVVGEGGAVNISGGNVMLVVDWSGAAIGGGGGNASAAEQDGGVVNITGGSLKTRINSNAYGQWGLTAAADDPGYQINDVAITADKLNGAGEAVYMLSVSLKGVTANTEGDKYVVTVDGNAYYSGDGYVHTFSADTSSTVANWPAGDTDNSLYLYLTGEKHTVSVNGTETTYYWDADASAFTTTKPTYAWYEAGTDTASYTISTAEELVQFAAIVNGTDENYAQDSFADKTVALANDIALAEDGLYTATENVTYGTSSWPMTTTQYVISADAPVWTPIGSGSASGNTVSSTANAFAGTFDGQGYTISGIYTGTTDAAAANTATVQGLFGIVTGTVKNVTVSGCITGSSVVGGVAAYLCGGTVENCVNNAIVFADGGTTPNAGSENGTSRAGATGGIVGLAAGTGSVTSCTNNGTVICTNTAKGGRVGGIVGLIDQSGDAISISKCVNNGAVEGYQYVAGICGMNYAANSPIDRCVNTADITMHGGGKAHAGGIAGQFDCQITNCYNTGNIHATHIASQEPRYFGGIAGDYNYSTGNGKIINCYTTGTVTYDFGSARDTGIIVGESGYAVNSYFLDTALTGSGSAVSQFDGISKTDAEMKADAMAGLLGDAFHVDTDSINNGYPVLDWQGGSVYVPKAPYIITTAEELLMLAEEVNAGETKVGETYTLGNDIDLSTVCSAELGTWNAIGGAAEKVILSITSQEELDAALYEYNILYDDTGWSYKYGTDKNLPYDANRTYYAVVGQIFSGTFDGAGYTISNLYVLSETGYAGLFGNVDGTLKNFTVKGTVTTATGTTEVDFVGGVTGKLSEGGRIEGVISYVNVDASAKAYNVGGIAGFCGTKNATADNAFSSAENTCIVECVNYGSVYGWSQVGGIAGENAGQILRCANYGDVDALKSGSKAGIGGIAGRNGCNNTAYTAGTIIDCYNFGTIATSDNKWCGGIAGFNNAESLIQNCYNVGTVNGTGQANAICGQNEGTGDNGVYNCWYLDSTKVFDESGVYGGNYADCGPKTEAEMKAPVFAAILGASFNVDSDQINEGYPVLKWQGGSEAPAIYTVTIPANGEGYTVAIADGYTTTVVEGGEFKFSVYLLAPYQIVSVKAGETELTAVNGVYTIENITSDVTVTITVACGHSYEHGVCTVCGEADPAYIIASGWSGYTTWTLNKDGILTFSPTDQTEGGQCNLRNYWKVGGVLTLPWGEYAEQITAVVIEDGIHDIGQMAFYELPNLTTVTLGADVVEIRNYAFKNCVSLTTVTGTENLRSICEGAFYGCSALTTLEIPEGCTVGAWAFSKSGITAN